MSPLFIVILVFLGVMLFGFLLWVFLVHGKRAEKERIAPFQRPYAHRGLYDCGIPENSLPAFLRAAALGFAIELDVQLSSDGEVMVFHDYTLDRMCGVEGKLSETPTDVLKKLSLDGTEYGIPTFREVLDAVGGRVPLLVELKGESTDSSLCPRVAALLDGYCGEWCVESFNPMLLRWFYKNRRGAVRGLLVTDLRKEKREGSKLLNLLLTAECLNVLCRPMFLAWDRKYPNGRALRFNRTCGIASFVYTVRDPEEYSALLARGNAPIFEHFVPNEPFIQENESRRREG